MKEFLNKQEWKHSVKVTIRQFLYLPCVLAVVMLLMIPGANALLSASTFRKMCDFGERVGWDNFIGFSLYDETLIARFIPYVLMGVGLISAYLLFRFLFSKKAQAMYFLTGVSRGQLFLVRYIFGAVSLAAAVFLAMAVSVCMNIAVAGTTGTLFANALYLFFAMFSTAFCCYSVCVVIMILSGRGIDYYLSAIGVLCARLLVLLFLQNVFFAFLPGAPYAFGRGNPEANHYPTIFENYAHLSFVDAFKETFETCGTIFGLKESTDFSYWIEKSVKEPHVILLLCAVGVLFGVLGWLLLKKRKAELAEMPNANRVLSNCVAILAPMSLASCVFFIDNTVLFVLLFALISVLGYCILYSVFSGTVRKLHKALPIPAAAAFVGCVFCLICHFGGLGYSSYIPDVDDIEAVQISYPGHPQYAPTGGGYSSVGFTSTSQSPYYYHYGTPDNIPRLTGKEEIETAVRLHRALIADGSRVVTEENEENYGETAVNANIYVTYTLKNGRQFTRFYRVLKLSTIETLLELELTDTYKAMLESKLKYFGKDQSAYGTTNEAELEAIFTSSVVYAADNLLSNITPLSLTNEEKTALFDAILRDKSDDTIAERYHPTKECLGVLLVPSREIDMTDTDDFHYFDYVSFSGTNFIYVYGEDTETAAYLREKGLYGAFEKAYTVTKMEIYDYPLYPSFRDWQKVMAYNRCFYARVNAALSWEVGSLERVIPTEEYADILQRARLTYFTDGGDLVVITTVNADGEERVVTKYLPK